MEQALNSTSETFALKLNCHEKIKILARHGIEPSRPRGPRAVSGQPSQRKFRSKYSRFILKHDKCIRSRFEEKNQHTISSRFRQPEMQNKETARTGPTLMFFDCVASIKGLIRF